MKLLVTTEHYKNIHCNGYCYIVIIFSYKKMVSIYIYIYIYIIQFIYFIVNNVIVYIKDITITILVKYVYYI